MKASKLDRHVSFERKAEEITETGATLETWATFLTVRAEVRDLMTDQVTLDLGEGEKATRVFVIRWTPETITTEDRVSYNGQSYDIRQIVELGRRGGLQITGAAV
ncbi:phage head closure protein [Celeribacter sp.]|uniref:phage head closure protein n=1 Tax=Celeribacter sp. TaxID=1890673 RepID=UPI003A911C55